MEEQYSIVLDSAGQRVLVREVGNGFVEPVVVL